MIPTYDFNSVAGSLILDARMATAFKGALSGNLAVSFSNLEDNQSVYLFTSPNGFTLSFGSVNFPSGVSFSTSADSYVRVTRVAGVNIGEQLLP